MNRTQMIYEELLKRLDAGVYPPGSKFPPETVLAEEFQVNKQTINKIVAMVAGTGRLIRGKSGAGTRVAEHFFHPRGNLFYIGPLTQYSSMAVSGFQSECLLREQRNGQDHQQKDQHERPDPVDERVARRIVLRRIVNFPFHDRTTFLNAGSCS